MFYRLIMPLLSTGSGLQGYYRITIKVGSLPIGSIKIVNGRTQSRIHPTFSLINAQTSPIVGSAVIFAVHPFPSIITMLARLGNGMEDPLQVTGVCIVS